MNYDELEAGTELDALVDERVMEQQKPLYAHALHFGTINDGEWTCIPDCCGGDECDWQPRPLSTNIVVAMESLERFTDVIIEKSGENWTVQIAQGGFEPVTRPSLPHAISIAVCKASTTKNNEVKK